MSLSDRSSSAAMTKPLSVMYAVMSPASDSTFAISSAAAWSCAAPPGRSAKGRTGLSGFAYTSYLGRCAENWGRP